MWKELLKIINRRLESSIKNIVGAYQRDIQRRKLKVDQTFSGKQTLEMF